MTARTPLGTTRHVAVHTPLCAERRAAFDAYVKQYPNYCRTCGGRGVIYIAGSRTDPPNSDPCACAEDGRCPRCGAETKDTEEHASCDYLVCNGCGFNEWAMIDSGADYGVPDAACVCWLDDDSKEAHLENPLCTACACNHKDDRCICFDENLKQPVNCRDYEPRPVHADAIDIEKTLDLAKAFLTYAFQDIKFKYDGLTERKRKLCTREEFERLVLWVRS